MIKLKLKQHLSVALLEIERHGSFGFHLTFCLDTDIYEALHEFDVVHFVEVKLSESDKEEVILSNIIDWLDDAGLWDDVENIIYDQFITFFQGNGIMSVEVFEHNLKLN